VQEEEGAGAQGQGRAESKTLGKGEVGGQSDWQAMRAQWGCKEAVLQTVKGGQQEDDPQHQTVKEAGARSAL